VQWEKEQKKTNLPATYFSQNGALMDCSILKMLFHCAVSARALEIRRSAKEGDAIPEQCTIATQ
jgi:hypothetical protein